MKCRNCGKHLKWPYFSVWIARGDTTGWFCSSKCVIDYTGLPGKQNSFGVNGCVTALFMLPFVLAWALVKLIFKLIFLPFTLIFRKKKDKSVEAEA